MDSVQLSMQDLHCRCKRSIAKRRIDCVDWTARVDPKVLTFQDVTKKRAKCCSLCANDVLHLLNARPAASRSLPAFYAGAANSRLLLPEDLFFLNFYLSGRF